MPAFATVTWRLQQGHLYLKKFDAGDIMVTPIAYGAIGDRYVEP